MRCKATMLTQVIMVLTQNNHKSSHRAQSCFKQLPRGKEFNSTSPTKHILYRANKTVDFTIKSTKLHLSRIDPIGILADSYFNITNRKLRPLGPVSKSFDLIGGANYRKTIHKNLDQHGDSAVGKMRKVQSLNANVLWIYNINLPTYKLGKELAPKNLY